MRNKNLVLFFSFFITSFFGFLTPAVYANKYWTNSDRKTCRKEFNIEFVEASGGIKPPSSMAKFYCDCVESALVSGDTLSESVNFCVETAYLKYKKIDKNLYRTFDLANFLRGEEGFEDSIELYNEILSKIENDHDLYPKVLDRRGTAYERIGNWELAEKDLSLSLKILPNQAYTINYLAYSWIEKEINTEKAITMIKKADNLK